MHDAARGRDPAVESVAEATKDSARIVSNAFVKLLPVPGVALLALAACGRPADPDLALVVPAGGDRAAGTRTVDAPTPPTTIAKTLKNETRSTSLPTGRASTEPSRPREEKTAIDPHRYAWLTEAAADRAEALVDRFDPPAGFRRVELHPGSFAEWLRGLPLAPRGTPVRAYHGGVHLPPDHPAIAAVSTLDVGTADLQQCADAILRLHAEWQWATGARDVSYPAASGTALPYARWSRGDRIVPDGARIRWERRARPQPRGDHAAFRHYLDTVFAWANTGSLSRDAQSVDPDDLRPGDAFVLPGNPGHAVIVLDVAEGPDGSRAALLGQSYMPAQTFQVLRPRARGAAVEGGSPWFVLRSGEPIRTPFWKPFPWSSLRRLAAG